MDRAVGGLRVTQQVEQRPDALEARRDPALAPPVRQRLVDAGDARRGGPGAGQRFLPLGGRHPAEPSVRARGGAGQRGDADAVAAGTVTAAAVIVPCASVPRTETVAPTANEANVRRLGSTVASVTTIV